MIATIARREAAARAGSPFAWILLAVVHACAAFIFLLHLETLLQAQGSPSAPGVTSFLVPRLFGAVTTLHLVAVPLLTMDLIAGERRHASLPLLLSSPVTPLQIVLGKLLGTLPVLVALVGLTALMPTALAPFADLDAGALALATLGSLLFAVATASTGLFMSALTRQPVTAAIATTGLLLVLLLLGEWGRQLGGLWAALLPYPAPSTHLEPFFSGLFDSGALAFFALFTALFVVLAVRRLDNERLRR